LTLHVDLDDFFSYAEFSEYLELKGNPVVVGAGPKKKEKGAAP